MKVKLQERLLILYQITCDWGRNYTQVLSSPPFTGGKICDRDQIDHGGARQK